MVLFVLGSSGRATVYKDSVQFGKVRGGCVDFWTRLLMNLVGLPGLRGPQEAKGD